VISKEKFNQDLQTEDMRYETAEAIAAMILLAPGVGRDIEDYETEEEEYLKILNCLLKKTDAELLEEGIRVGIVEENDNV
jgi:hypothetical protein